MTDAINYIQSIFTERAIAAGNLSKEEIRLAHDITREAREAVTVADEEARNGFTAQGLAITNRDSEAARKLATIAVWHYERAARKYHEAIEWFGQAAKLWPQAKRVKLMKYEAKEMDARAGQAESAVRFLNDFLTQN